MREPRVVVFDVNETLSDMSPMQDRFAEIGAPGELARLWFATVLRDGFALTAAGGSERFAAVAETALRGLVSGTSLTMETEAAVQHVMSGFMGLQVHADVPDGVHALRAAGLRLVTLTNGSTQVSERLLSDAGILREYDHLLSVEEAGVWKPARAAYEYAAQVCRTDMADMLLVAAHPWDINGAARAGMSTAWINRTSNPYPDYFAKPDTTIATLGELATAIDR